MSVVSLPPSFNYAETKPAATSAGSAVFSKIRSDGITYSAGDVLRLTLPTGANQFLSPQDSFVSFKFTPTFTNTGGLVRLDGTAYSLIKRLTVYHGSSMVENITNANRLFNAIYDIQVSQSDRATGTINLLIDENQLASPAISNGYMYGAALTSGVAYQVSFTLPSILGAFSDKALPLAWLNNAEIFLEIELESATKVLTTRVANSISGATGVGVTTALAVTGYSISEFYYNACITNLSSDVGNVLKQAMLSRPLVIPAISYRGEQRVVSAGATSFADKLSFQFSSMKGMMWWLTNAQTSNGTIANTNLGSAITTRASGDLDQFWVSLDGADFPASHIKAGVEIAGVSICGAEVLGHLERYLNQNSVPGYAASLTKDIYCNSVTTYASDLADAKKFVAAISLDRFDNDNQRQLQGTNTMSSQVQINVAWTTDIDEQCNLYAYAMYDLGLEIVDGLLVPRY
jgi:hypothetical protein